MKTRKYLRLIIGVVASISSIHADFTCTLYNNTDGDIEFSVTQKGIDKAGNKCSGSSTPMLVKSDETKTQDLYGCCTGMIQLNGKSFPVSNLNATYQPATYKETWPGMSCYDVKLEVRQSTNAQGQIRFKYYQNEEFRGETEWMTKQ